ncbi:cupin domain-containing protein [Alphaproteobacteria bacterium]|nr:cupin domain-containing protein [Alphaproteobacteria bacterium]
MNNKKYIESLIPKFSNDKNQFFEKRIRALIELIILNCGEIKLSKINDMVNSEEYNNKNISLAEKYIYSLNNLLLEENIISKSQLKIKLEKLKLAHSSQTNIKDTTIDFIPKNGKIKKLKKLEGHPVNKGINLLMKIKTINQLMFELHYDKESFTPLHYHTDHETTSFLISGKLSLTIGEKNFIAVAGDSWIHQKNISHKAHAIEPSVQLSFKTPPIKTW